MRRFLAIVLLTCLALLSAVSTSVANAPALAVLNFTNRNPGDGWDWLGVGLADMLVTDLGRSRNVQVIDRERLALIQRELGVYSRVTEQNGAVRCARVAAASHAVFGLYSVAHGRVEIQALVIGVADGSLLRVEAVQGQEGDILSLEKTLAERILQRLNLPMTEAELVALRRPATRDVHAARRFYLGQQALDGGDPQTALAEFRQAAQADPAYAKARLAAADAYRRLDEGAHACAAYRDAAARFPNTPEAAEALFGLSRVCRTMPDGCDEALTALEKLRTDYPGVKLVAPGFAPFSSSRALSPAEFALMETGDVLVAAGRCEEAIRAYQQVAASDPPHFSGSVPVGFTPAGVMMSQTPMPSNARTRIEDAVREMYRRAGCLPSLPSGLVILTPQAPIYAEDYSTDKRLRDGWLIASAGTKRLDNGYEYGFVPASAGVPAGIRDATDKYRFGAAKGHAFKSVKITLNAIPVAGASYGARVKHGYTGQPLRTVFSGQPLGTVAAGQPVAPSVTEIVPLAPGTAFLVLDVYTLRTRLTSWRVEAELERVESAGRLEVKSAPSRARVLLDGVLVGRSPCVVPNVPAGDHEIECVWPHEEETWASYGQPPNGERPALFGTWRGKAKVTVAAGAECRATVALSPAEKPVTAWQTPVCVATAPSRSYDAPAVDLAVGAREAGVVLSDGHALWLARGTPQGDWLPPEKLSAAINGLAPATMPRLLALDDGRWLLAWKVSYTGFARVMTALSDDLRAWSAPVQMLDADQPVMDIALLLDHRGQPALFWMINREPASPNPEVNELYCRNPLAAQEAASLGRIPGVHELFNKIGIDSDGNVVLAANQVYSTAEPGVSRTFLKVKLWRGAWGRELRAVDYDKMPLTGSSIFMFKVEWKVRPDGTLCKVAEPLAPREGMRLRVSRDGAAWRDALELPVQQEFSVLRSRGGADHWILWQCKDDFWVSRRRAE